MITKGPINMLSMPMVSGSSVKKRVDVYGGMLTGSMSVAGMAVTGSAVGAVTLICNGSKSAPFSGLAS